MLLLFFFFFWPFSVHIQQLFRTLAPSDLAPRQQHDSNSGPRLSLSPREHKAVYSRNQLLFCLADCTRGERKEQVFFLLRLARLVAEVV